ncbi:UBA6 enzyme, partial [Polypterus senegalus]
MLQGDPESHMCPITREYVIGKAAMEVTYFRNEEEDFLSDLEVIRSHMDEMMGNTSGSGTIKDCGKSPDDELSWVEGRQRYVLGDSAMQQMAQSHVFLSGMGGLGIEIVYFLVKSHVQVLRNLTKFIMVTILGFDCP